MPSNPDSDPVPEIQRSGTKLSALSGSSQSSQSVDDEVAWSHREIDDHRWSTIDSNESLHRSGVSPLHDSRKLLYLSNKMVDQEACWERQVVLSLDGGGMRGLSELLILNAIMEEVARIEQDFEGAQAKSSSDIPWRKHRSDEESIAESEVTPSVDNFLPCHYFDYICGTSLGGVIAVLLGRLRCSVGEAICYYRVMWDEMAKALPHIDRVIPRSTSKKDCSTGLGRALDDILCRQQKIRAVRSEKGSPDEITRFQSSERLCKTLVLAVKYDNIKHIRRPYLFRSYPFSPSAKTSTLNRNIRERGDEVLTKDVCLATSASPNHFRGHRIGATKFRDGSIWMANPSMELYREVDSIYAETENPLYCFVSIGSGKQRKGIAERTLRQFSPGGVLRRKSAYEREQELVDQVLTKRNDSGQNFYYFRLEGPGDLPNVRPSTWKSNSQQKIVQRITSCTENYFRTKSIKREIEEIASKLVQYRRLRAKTSAWSTYVDMPITETSRHTCKRCNSCNDADRDMFIDHVRRKHPKEVRNSRCLDDYRGLLQESQIPTIVTVRE
ncbi:FabD/lysophospholipase-like protein [Lojkania enalia]|uniref:FabD/lysophospholipase-like protein n=1 Tax=Lojkania enalia TaxID=147567 RepID=A0A9P4TQG6_9PLEO|nr:FabD/lysophospholipase-like protein [Didymosphaeria enalia]